MEIPFEGSARASQHVQICGNHYLVWRGRHACGATVLSGCGCMAVAVAPSSSTPLLSSPSSRRNKAHGSFACLAHNNVVGLVVAEEAEEGKEKPNLVKSGA